MPIEQVLVLRYFVRVKIPIFHIKIREQLARTIS
jgi:hypothetical protein